MSKTSLFLTFALEESAKETPPKQCELLRKELIRSEIVLLIPQIQTTKYSLLENQLFFLHAVSAAQVSHAERNGGAPELFNICARSLPHRFAAAAVLQYVQRVRQQFWYVKTEKE